MEVEKRMGVWGYGCGRMGDLAAFAAFADG
jgi:hypothetical protein